MSKLKYVNNPYGYIYKRLDPRLQSFIKTKGHATFHSHLKAFCALEGYNMTGTRALPNRLVNKFLRSLDKTQRRELKISLRARKESVTALLDSIANLP